MYLLHAENISNKNCHRPRNPKPKRLYPALLIIASLGIAACTPQIDYRGYLPRGTDVQKIQTGLSKTEVISILGSPSTTSTVQGAGDTFYYISSIIKTAAILEPEVVDREIFAIEFDTDQNVKRLANYGIEDGKIIDFISRKTPTRGSNTSIIRGLFGRIGQFGAPVEPTVPDDF
jgi:outer membrane protein assembly factor BamE (lipoprotein component of BamABCDE complex)